MSLYIRLYPDVSFVTFLGNIVSIVSRQIFVPIDRSQHQKNTLHHAIELQCVLTEAAFSPKLRKYLPKFAVMRWCRKVSLWGACRLKEFIYLSPVKPDPFAGRTVINVDAML
jgi:hypothetical protein